jgi:hypothetical protein
VQLDSPKKLFLLVVASYNIMINFPKLFSPGNIGTLVKSDASQDKLEDLFKHVQRTSPALDIIRNAGPVMITIES